MPVLNLDTNEKKAALALLHGAVSAALIAELRSQGIRLLALAAKRPGLTLAVLAAAKVYHSALERVVGRGEQPDQP